MGAQKMLAMKDPEGDIHVWATGPEALLGEMRKRVLRRLDKYKKENLRTGNSYLGTVQYVEEVSDYSQPDPLVSLVDESEEK